MNQPTQVLQVLQPLERRWQWGDMVVLLGMAVLIYAGVSLAIHTPLRLRGPDISLAPAALPYYALHDMHASLALAPGVLSESAAWLGPLNVSP
jgi:hypothetical protein